MKKIFITSVVFLVGFALMGSAFYRTITDDRKHSTKNNNTMNNETTTAGSAIIYFAGGCFWGTEHFFKQITGVTATEVGYANGHVTNPTYEQVVQNNTGFAETVKVAYNPENVDLNRLLDLYFKSIDPTSLNKQGNDRGTQYRTGIYYTQEDQLPLIKQAIATVAKQYTEPIVVEVSPLENFYTAEDYHQDYLDKNPNGYCHISPALFELARKADVTKQPAKEELTYTKPDAATLRKTLTPQQYAVTQENATERPFDNEYNDEFREGIYVDITTGEPLFVSTDKFESGCGWPSFSKPISDSLIDELQDNSFGMHRTEVRSKTGDAHLGHVFNDGPKEKGGLRYCINSASLRFIPKADMEKEGYAKYLPLVKPADALTSAH